MAKKKVKKQNLKKLISSDVNLLLDLIDAILPDAKSETKKRKPKKWND